MKKQQKFKSTTKQVEKIKKSRGLIDEELCVLLGITKPTLYKRKKKHDWKVSEISHINNLLKEEV